MGLSSISQYINPMSPGGKQARADFGKLTTIQKVITIAASALAGIATIFLLGAGGFATFKALVDNFKKPSEPSEQKPGPVDHAVGGEDHEVSDTISQAKKLLDKCEFKSLVAIRTSNRLEDIIDLREDEIAASIFYVSGMSETDVRTLLESEKENPERFLVVATGVAGSRTIDRSKKSRIIAELKWPTEKTQEIFLSEVDS